MEQWLKEKQHTSAFIGLGCSLACLFVFGADHFIIPAMTAIFALLTFLRRPLEKERQNNDSIATVYYHRHGSPWGLC